MPHLDEPKPGPGAIPGPYLKRRTPARRDVIKLDRQDGATVVSSEVRNVVRLRDKERDSFQDIDLSDWASRPGLRDALFDFFTARGPAMTPQTRMSRVQDYRKFREFLDRDRPDMATLSGVDTYLLNDYADWLHFQLSRRSLDDGSSEARTLSPMTMSGHYGALRQFLRYCRGVPHLASHLPGKLDLTKNPWPGAHKSVQSHQAMDQDAFGRLIGVCLKEIDETIECLSVGADARANDGIVVPTQETKKVAPYLDMQVRLRTVIERYDERVPDFRMAAVDDWGFSQVLRDPHGTQAVVVKHLHFTMRSILPFVLVLAMRTAFNPETILKLKQSAVRREHPLWGKERWVIKGSKGRAGHDQSRSFPARGDDLTSPVRIIEALVGFGAAARRRLDPHLRDSLFAFWNMQDKRFQSFDHLAAGGSGWGNCIKAFRRDNRDLDLPSFSLVTIRATAADLIDKASKGDIKAKQILLGHRNVRTTVGHYHSPLAKREGAERLAVMMGARERYLSTGGLFDTRNGDGATADLSAVTPGFKCQDNTRSPQRGQTPGRPCDAFGACPTCENAFVDREDPKSCRRLLQLGLRIEAAKDAMDDQRWIGEWQPRLAALEGYWLHGFSAKARAEAATADIRPVPRIE